jgi:GST-like protein
MDKPITLYIAPTPNGRKVSIMLEETGLEYTAHEINIMEGDQNAPEFLKISPNNKIPAIVDGDVTLMESGAILIYLAEKTGQFMPTEKLGRLRTLEWLMWQMGGVGPILGQVHHFVKYNQGKSAYAEQRYLTEGKRLYSVLNTRLADNEYLNGVGYSIADMATWPWIARYDWQTIDPNDYPNVKRWYLDLASRDAVKRGWDVPRATQEMPIP